MSRELFLPNVIREKLSRFYKKASHVSQVAEKSLIDFRRSFNLLAACQIIYR